VPGIISTKGVVFRNETSKGAMFQRYKFFLYLPVSYLLLYGYFGNQYYVRLAQEFKLHLISKLKYTSALYLPNKGEYSGKERKNKY